MPDDVETTVTETSPIAQTEQNERDVLIAAVDAANGKEPETKKADEEPKPKEGDAPAESKVAAVLRAREQAQAARDERAATKAESDQIKAEMAALRAETERMHSEAKSELARIQKLKSAPLSAIKELGWDHKQLVDEVVREGTPEWQAQKRYEAALEKQAEEIAEMKAWREEQKAFLEKQNESQKAYARQQVEKKFLDSFPSESAMRILYNEQEIVAKGHTIADEYREKSNGKVARIEEIRDYLEEQAAERLAAIRNQPSGDTGSRAPESARKVAAPPKANGPRALSGSAASERRSSPKPRHEWTPEEEYSALKAAAESAMK